MKRIAAVLLSVLLGLGAVAVAAPDSDAANGLKVTKTIGSKANGLKANGLKANGLKANGLK